MSIRNRSSQTTAFPCLTLALAFLLSTCRYPARTDAPGTLLRRQPQPPSGAGGASTCASSTGRTDPAGSAEAASSAEIASSATPTTPTVPENTVSAAAPTTTARTTAPPTAFPASPPTPATTATTAPTTLPATAQTSAANSDIIGQLTLHGTGIRYPVVRSHDHVYYTKHDVNKNASRDGAIFLDYRLEPDFSNINNIVYGHNTGRGTMFSGLGLYKKKDYFDSHQTGQLVVDGAAKELLIFSVYTTYYKGNPYTWYFITEYAFELFAEQLRADSLYWRDVGLQWGDRIVTLSTCSYEFENARTVVHAKIVG